MSISFNSAINAYRNAASFAASPSDNVEQPSGNDAFSSLVAQPAENSISLLRGAERVAIGSLTKQADITDVVTAVNQAESTLKTVIAVRDRLISAFQDLEKMPI